MSDQQHGAVHEPAPEAPPELVRVALRDAHAFYRQPRTLDPSWVPDYLNRRNLYPQLRYAGIGYAPAGWTTLLAHLRGRGHTDEVIVAAGLARAASTGSLIDHFRDRLMIPVVDPDRQLVGFIGRASADADPEVPKYLNSPATTLFDKGRLLYALGEDRAELVDGAMPVLVEGPLDRLAIRQAAGNLAVVGLAPLGTAFTAHQAEQLADAVGPWRPVAVALDPDGPGREATVRAWDRLTEAGFRNLFHVSLPSGRDPADLVRGGRGQDLRHAIVGARPLSIAVADHKIAAAGTLDHWQQRFAVLTTLLDHDLRRVAPDRLAPYLAHLAQRLDLDYQDVTAAAADRLSPTGAGTYASVQERAPGTGPPGPVVDAFTARVHSQQGFPAAADDPRTSSSAAAFVERSGERLAGHDLGLE